MLNGKKTYLAALFLAIAAALDSLGYMEYAAIVRQLGGALGLLGLGHKIAKM